MAEVPFHSTSRVRAAGTWSYVPRKDECRLFEETTCPAIQQSRASMFSAASACIVAFSLGSARNSGGGYQPDLRGPYGYTKKKFRESLTNLSRTAASCIENVSATRCRRNCIHCLYKTSAKKNEPCVRLFCSFFVAQCSSKQYLFIFSVFRLMHTMCDLDLSCFHWSFRRRVSSTNMRTNTVHSWYVPGQVQQSCSTVTENGSQITRASSRLYFILRALH